MRWLAQLAVEARDGHVQPLVKGAWRGRSQARNRGSRKQGKAHRRRRGAAGATHRVLVPRGPAREEHARPHPKLLARAGECGPGTGTVPHSAQLLSKDAVGPVQRCARLAPDAAGWGEESAITLCNNYSARK
jgi:hypothetical protein